MAMRMGNCGIVGRGAWVSALPVLVTLLSTTAARADQPAPAAPAAAAPAPAPASTGAVTVTGTSSGTTIQHGGGETPTQPSQNSDLNGPKIDSSPPTGLPATTAGQSVPAQQAAMSGDADDAYKKYKSRYEPLRVKGWNVDFPLPEQTLTGDNPFRQALADNHLGFYFYGIAYAGANMLDVARSSPTGVQLYNGQRLTTRTTPSGIINYDMSWLGLENAQLSGAFCYVTTNWDPAGPPEMIVSHLSYYQTFFKKTLELKVGYLTNNFEFYGPYVGGNLASALFGQSASVITATGLSHTVAPRPAANLQLNVGHYYEKSGIQYSSSPDGYVTEQNQNETGLKWTIPNAHVLFIEEVGYKTAATKETRSSWARFGYIRNTSDFVDYQFGGRSNKNYVFYGMADHQFIKLNHMPSEAAGIYLGYSAHLGLDRYSSIAQTYEARMYAQGFIKSRPADMASFIVDYNKFSIYAVADDEKKGIPTVPNNWVATWAYNAGIVPGLIAGVALSYSDHPAAVVNYPGTGHALQAITNFTFFL